MTTTKKLVSLSFRLRPSLWQDLRQARDRMNKLREVGSPAYTITDVVARFIAEGIARQVPVETKGKP
jgi:hypothetical protein